MYVKQSLITWLGFHQRSTVIFAEADGNQHAGASTVMADALQ